VVRGDEGVSDYSLPGMAFSAIVPVLNGVETIGEMLDALAEQKTSSQWEVVVADNGSSDGTRDLVRSRARDFPVPLRLIDASAVTGVAFARNAGALAASGVGIAFCDADDRVGGGGGGGVSAPHRAPPTTGSGTPGSTASSSRSPWRTPWEDRSASFGLLTIRRPQSCAIP
jgi:cellulose synthase/poly-beta-1,6-N-acetylglucosamine synthase-like glycosyltransferase